MRKFILITAMLATSIGSPAFAETAKISVNGLVCAFCAEGIKRTFGKLDTVKDTIVDLDAKLVTIDFQPSKTIDDATLTTLVKNAGYDVVKIERVN